MSKCDNIKSIKQDALSFVRAVGFVCWLRSSSVPECPSGRYNRVAAGLVTLNGFECPTP